MVRGKVKSAIVDVFMVHRVGWVYYFLLQLNCFRAKSAMVSLSTRNASASISTACVRSCRAPKRKMLVRGSLISSG